jgi:hypothetical protein
MTPTTPNAHFKWASGRVFPKMMYSAASRTITETPIRVSTNQSCRVRSFRSPLQAGFLDDKIAFRFRRPCTSVSAVSLHEVATEN